MLDAITGKFTCITSSQYYHYALCDELKPALSMVHHYTEANYLLKIKLRMCVFHLNYKFYNIDYSYFFFQIRDLDHIVSLTEFSTVIARTDIIYRAMDCIGSTNQGRESASYRERHISHLLQPVGQKQLWALVPMETPARSRLPSYSATAPLNHTAK